MSTERRNKYTEVSASTRLENNLKNEDRKRALLERILAKGKNPKPPAQPETSSIAPDSPVDLSPPIVPQPLPESPFSAARSGKAGVAVFDRGATNVSLTPEPWLVKLVNAALEASASHQLRLELVWPGTVRSVPLIHAFATLERFAIGDKRGLRTLDFPTKRSSFAALNQWLLERNKLLEITQRFLTVTQGSDTQPPLEGRDDQNKDMVLMTLNSALAQDSQIEPPSIAEVQPHFEWDLNTGGWGHYGDRFLKRTKGVLQRAHRKALWNAGDDGRIAKLGAPQSAPDALFGVSHLATAKEWKAALACKEFRGDGQPELVLLDLTKEIRRTTDRNLIRLVPEVIDAVREKWKSPVGILIVTDDPKTYFTLRKQLTEKEDGNRNAVICEPIVSIRDDYGISHTPLSTDWIPPTVSDKHFLVGVLDHELADAAVRLWTISQSFEQDSSPQRALRGAVAFLLRLANLPGGYHDYIAWMEASAFADSIRADMAWNGHEAKLQGLIERGEFDDKAEAVRRATNRATKFVQTYFEATPMAKRIAKELDFRKFKASDHIAVVLRYNLDIAVARAFLARYTGFNDGQPFASIAERIEFINHKELSRVLASDNVPAKFIFVGLPDETLKELLTSERVPAHSVVLFDWQRANNVLTGLLSLKTIETYRPYRGRISLFASEIQRCIKALPKAIDVEKLSSVRVPRLSLSAAASEASRRAEGPPSAYKLEFEDIGRIVVGHRVYIYEPDEKEAFQSRNIENVVRGDLVFVMSDELRDLFEIYLIEAGHGITRGSSFGDMLRNYHHDVLTNSKRIFGDLNMATLARNVKKRMEELQPEAKECSTSRLRYWLDVQGDSETPAEDLKPHSTWKKSDFETFARALEIPSNLLPVYWLMVTGQRKALQQAGREITERYAHVLFTEEVAELHYHLTRDNIVRLQNEAVRNTHRVVMVVPPLKMEKSHGNT